MYNGSKMMLATMAPRFGCRAFSAFSSGSDGGLSGQLSTRGRLAAPLTIRCQSRRSEATLAAVAGAELDFDSHRGDYNDHETWYEQTRTTPDFDVRYEELTVAERAASVSPLAVTVHDDVKSFEEIPGPRGFPLIGNVLSYSKFGPYSFEKILENRLEYAGRYGKIYKEKLGPMWMVNLFDPTDLATMFRLEGRYPSRGKIAGLEVSYLQRNNKLVGFAFLDGPEWARQRACIQRLMMHPGTASKYVEYQMPVARDFADYLGSVRKSDGLVVDLYENLFKYTMESIAAVCFGKRIGAFDEDSDAANNGDAKRLSAAIAETFICFRSCMFNFPWYRYLRTPTYQRFERAANTMRQIMGKYVEAAQRRAADQHHHHHHLTVSGTSSSDVPSTCPFARSFADARKQRYSQAIEDGECVLDVLSHDKRVSSELAINLVMALFRTGIDSTGNALAFFLHNLACNPDKQDKLYAEIQEATPASGDLTGDLLQRMPYLKACLRESFRLNYPVFGGSGRVMPEDTVFSGFKVPKGVFIFANMAAMSRMEEYFPRALEYHPERWLRDGRAMHCSTWSRDSAYLSLPFSHGLRACPGKRFAEQGLYTAVVAILRKFRLEIENKEMGMIHMPFTIPDRPLMIKFKTRVNEDHAHNHDGKSQD